MAQGTFQVSTKRLLGLCLIIFGAVSCTYDYFEDETNFLLYVPQIENNEISRFCVEFHDANGRHVRTRQVEAPFDRDESMKQGILRFKLNPGEYSISCFANYASGSITEGESYDNSYKKALAKNPGAQGDVYTPWNTNARALFFDTTVYPIGHPGGKDPVQADIDPSQCFKGQVASNFIDLPTEITRIDIFAAGVATKFKFDGDFELFSSADRLTVSSNTADMTRNPTDGSLSFTDFLIPSVGIDFKEFQAGMPVSGARSMELEVRFYGEGDRLLGTTIVNDETIPMLDPGSRPTDGSGNPVSKLVLEPRKKLIFTFKGFSIFKVELKGWGDIVPGETTPL